MEVKEVKHYCAENFLQFLQLVKKELREGELAGSSYVVRVIVHMPFGETEVRLFDVEAQSVLPVCVVHIEHRALFKSGVCAVERKSVAPLMGTLHYYKAAGKLVKLLEMFFANLAPSVFLQTCLKLKSLSKRFEESVETLHMDFVKAKGDASLQLNPNLVQSLQLSSVGNVGDTYIDILKCCLFCFALEEFCKMERESESN